MKPLLFGLCIAGLLVGLSVDVPGQEKVTIRPMHPEGRTARYKNSYSFRFYCDRGELVLMEGAFDVTAYGEWKSREMVQPMSPKPGEEDQEETMGVMATVEKAGSQVSLDKVRLTYEEFPYTLDVLNGRQFSWRFTPDGRAHRFSPEFPPYKLRRQDMITDLAQVWLPGLCPAFPDGPVGEGDTWTGEQTFEMPYTGAAMRGQPALTELTSVYRVKKIRKKKGRQVAQIQEEREVRYRHWMRIEVLSLLLEGEGKGKGEWEIDVDRGLVLESKMQMDIGRPDVTIAGERRPVDDPGAQVRLVFKRKLEKLEKE